MHKKAKAVRDVESLLVHTLTVDHEAFHECSM